MKVSKDFEYALTDALYRLCNREQYFTCGTNRQYNRMFSMAVMPEYTYRDIAMMIFTCSEIPDGEDVNSFFSDIQNQVETIYNEILEDEALARMEEQQAAGERAADEVYCGYLD